MFSLPVWAGEDAALSRLYAELLEAPEAEAAMIADEIALEWTKSGSPAMDLLLRRGKDALEAGDVAAAREHFTALTDHAPDFAEGWHMRAVARARSGLLGPAMSDLERALALEPRHFVALYSLGSLLNEMGREDLAREAFEAARALNPYDKDTKEALERLGAAQDGTQL